jgi:hypothetical protein
MTDVSSRKASSTLDDSPPRLDDAPPIKRPVEAVFG